MHRPLVDPEWIVEIDGLAQGSQVSPSGDLVELPDLAALYLM